VHLEIEVGVKEERGGYESGGEGGIRRVEGPCVEDPSRTLRPLEKLGMMLPEAAPDLPPAAAAFEDVLGKGGGHWARTLEGPRVRAYPGHRLERLARVWIVESVEDQLGQPISERQREGHGLAGEAVPRAV